MLAASSIKLFKKRVMVKDLVFGEVTTAGGIILLDDDGKDAGIHARWAQVHAVAPDHDDLVPGDYVLLKHGRWSRGIAVLDDAGQEFRVHLIDWPDAVLARSKTRPVEFARVGL